MLAAGLEFFFFLLDIEFLCLETLEAAVYFVVTGGAGPGVEELQDFEYSAR